MAVSGSSRLRKHRDKLRRSGLRPIELWVPDTRNPAFAGDCARQAAMMAVSDRADADLMADLDAGLADIDEWT